jgi:hypothetical protein
MERVHEQASRAAWPKRVALAALMALIAMNVWIGGPLLALWIGSRVQAHSGGSLTIRPATALVVFGSLAAISVALMRALRAASGAYDRATGASAGPRRHDSWIATERRDIPGERPSLTTLERILVVVVACAALAFEIWFFFFSTSPIDQRTGRSSVPLALAAPAHAGESAGSPQLRNAARIARVAGERFSV